MTQAPTLAPSSSSRASRVGYHNASVLLRALKRRRASASFVILKNLKAGAGSFSRRCSLRTAFTRIPARHGVLRELHLSRPGGQT